LLAAQAIPAFCPDLAQKWLTFFVVLCFVLVTIVLNGKPQRSQLLAGGAVLNLAGNGIEPMLQAAVTDELSAFVDAMDKDDICPAFDAHDRVFGNFE
jgi:hypothetical protein